MPTIPAARWTVLGAGCARLHPGDDRLRSRSHRAGASSQPTTKRYTVLTPSRPPPPATWCGRASGRPRPGPNPGLRLPGEHRRPAAVRLAAAPGSRTMTLGNGLATLTPPLARRSIDFTINANAKFWDGSPVTAAGRRLQPRARGRPQGRRLLRRQSSTGSSRSRPPATRPSRSTSSSPTTGCSASSPRRPARSCRRSTSRPRARTFGTVSGGTMCSGPFKLDVLEDRPGRQDGPQPGLLGHHACPSRSSRA